MSETTSRGEGARWIAKTARFATLQWPLGRLSAPLMDAVLDASDVSGVRLYKCGNLLEVSQSAGRVLGTFFERLGVDDPFRATALDRPLPELARPLYEHQAEAAQWLVAHGGGLLADGMGVGKSAAAASAAVALSNGGVVVIIGPKYTRETWAAELVTLGLLDEPSELFRATGTKPDARGLGTHRFWFVHYQIAHSWCGYMAATPKGRPVVAIVDEAHWVRNAGSRMGAAVQALAGMAKHRILLTGTPLPHRTADLWALLTLVEGRGQWGTKFSFRVRYAGAVSNGYGHEDRGATHVAELRERLGHIYMRRTLTDLPMLDVPALTQTAVCVARTDAGTVREQKAWAELDVDPRELRAILRGLAHGTFGPGTLAALTRLRRASSKVKLAATVDHVSSVLAAGDSVVVFTWMRRTADAIAKQVTDRVVKLVEGAAVPPEVYVVHGKLAQTYRDGAVEDFQNTGGLLCATLDALREGVTLTKARHVVIHDLPWAPSDVLQAEARIARIGQTQPCVSWWMVARGCADELIARHLLQKVETQADATGDGVGRAAFDDAGLRQALGLGDISEWINTLAAWEEARS